MSIPSNLTATLITQKKQQTAFKELKTELEEIFKDHFEKEALAYFDFISWLKSKIENRPFCRNCQRKGA